MRHFRLNLLVILLCLIGVLAQAQTFEAKLTGRSEAPPVATNAYGEIVAELDGNQLSVSGYFAELEGAFDASIAGGAHIHIGMAGENGAIALPLVSTIDIEMQSGTFEEALNTFTLTNDQVSALMNRGMYINIHSTIYASGELRGQLLPQADAYYHINMMGNNEVPSIVTDGFGALALELRGNELTLSGAFSDLSGAFNAAIAGGAHLHMGLPGSNGGILIPINATTDADLKSGSFAASDNTFTLTEDQLSALENRMMYANIHTTAFAGGELRGQVASAEAKALFRAHLSATNEVPATQSMARGQVQAELIGDSLFVAGSFDGLESEIAVDIVGGAHLHSAMAGSNGGVDFPLILTASAGDTAGSFLVANNRFSLSTDQVEVINGRGIYVNIHSVDEQAGELRGQLLPESQVVLTSVLSGSFETTAVSSRAYGAVKAELTGNVLTVSGSFNNLSSALNVAIAGGAHLHLGLAGENGDVAFPLISTLDMSQTSGIFPADANRFTLSDAEKEALLERGFYVNIHSLNHPGGELRGQLLQEAQIYMASPLSGASEIPAVRTSASGLLMVELTRDSAIVSGVFANLSSAFDASIAGGSHLHNADAGANGGILVNINADLEADNLSGRFLPNNNTFAADASLKEQLRSRSVYANIHTTDFASGELRGQLLPAATSYFTVTLDPFNEVPIAESEAYGALKLELQGSTLVLSGSFSGLEGAFDESIAGGAHLHIGGPGENGGIAIAINASLAADQMSGAFLPEENTFSLTEEQVADLLSGDYYVNIHTTAYASGELRGQSLSERNFFPDAGATINFPPDGLDVLLEGSTNENFVVNWSPASDDNELAYIWQAALDENFENVIVEQNAGSELEIAFSLGDIDAMLNDLGVAVGQEVTIYHRTFASDGSLYTAGAISTVNVTRGEVMAERFDAQLSGHNEVLPVASAASGSVTAMLAGNELMVSGSFENLSAPVATEIAGGAHLHMGFAGQNGGVQFPLTLSLSEDQLSATIEEADNTFTLSTEQIATLRNRQMYVNIHSTNYMGGELRGQLLPAADEVYTISLLGSNEMPSALTRGYGALALEVDGDALVVSGSFSNLEGMFDTNIAGGAHLHLGLAGQNGGIEIQISAILGADMQSGVFRAEDNTFTLNSDQLNALEQRAIYANLHTILYPGGELRGQVVSDAQAVFRAHLSGSNELPVVTTSAQGVVIAELSNDTTLTVSGSFSGLESELATDIAGGAHIHMGLPGENGDVMVALTVNADADNTSGRFDAADNTFSITAAQREALLARGLYVNIHSVNNQGGELRGQLMLESQAVFTGFASGIQTVPQVSTSALGGLQAELSGSRFTLVGSFDGLESPVATDIAGGAHIHTAMAGATGDVLYPLNLTLGSDNTSGSILAADNTFDLEEDEAPMLLNRGWYFNLHSQDIQNGELRAQLLPEATTYFVAPLSGASEVPAVNTDASGMVIVEINGSNAFASGSFMNLSSALATDIAGGVHIHNGMAGANGPVAVLLNTDAAMGGTQATFPVADNRFAVTAGQIDTMRMRGNYVNVHSMDVQSGELRGQLLPLATTYFTTSLDGLNEVQPIMTDAMGGAKLELSNSQLVVSGAFSGLGSAFDASIAGGAHLHIAGPGANGDVDIALTTQLAGDQLSGLFAASDNTYDLTEEQESSLRQGNYYFNIHTMDNQAGELRGQALVETNAFPSDEAEITSPMDGAELTVAGDPNTPFTATWEAASDRDALAYIWQLATDEAFTNVLVMQNVGDNLAFTTDFATVDMLLANAGTDVGQSVTLYHRALASDGSVYTPGASASVVLTRGVVSSDLNVQPDAFSMKVYPTVAHDWLKAEIKSDALYNANLMISNANGQYVQFIPVRLDAGEMYKELDVQSFPAGKYYIQLAVEGQVLSTQTFIKQ